MWVESHVLFDCEITCFRVSCMRAHLKFERSATLMLDDHDIKYTSLGWGWPFLRVLQLRISVFAWRCTVAGIGVVDNMAAVAFQCICWGLVVSDYCRHSCSVPPFHIGSRSGSVQGIVLYCASFPLGPHRIFFTIEVINVLLVSFFIM